MVLVYADSNVIIWISVYLDVKGYMCECVWCVVCVCVFVCVCVCV